MATQFLHMMNYNNVSTNLSNAADDVEMINAQAEREENFKSTAWVFTGVALEIEFKVPDDFNYCSEC